MPQGSMTWRASDAAALRAFPLVAPKRLLKCGWRGFWAQLVYHRRSQKRVGAPSSPNNQPTLPRRPLRGRTLSGASAPCGMVEKHPRARVLGKINPQKISHRPSSHPLEHPPPATPRPFLALVPLHRPKKALRPSGAFPPPSG
jgi:hypothetical protein